MKYSTKKRQRDESARHGIESEREVIRMMRKHTRKTNKTYTKTQRDMR